MKTDDARANFTQQETDMRLWMEGFQVDLKQCFDNRETKLQELISATWTEIENMRDGFQHVAQGAGIRPDAQKSLDTRDY